MTHAPICMAEEFWVTSPLSVARHYGQIQFNGHRYIVVDKKGRDLWEASMAADRRGSDKAIPAGEPADLLRDDFQQYYKKLGRDKFLEILMANQRATDKELKSIYRKAV